MINYTYTFSTSGDVQTAHTNGELGNPYVAYITATSGLDWNTLNIPQPSYKGEWSGYTFTINDSGATAWENPVEIATIPTAYIQGDECSVSVTLRFEYDVWWLKFEAEGQSASDEFELEPELTSEVDTEYVKLNSSASESDDASVHIRFDKSNNKNIISFSSTDDNIQPLVMNTINIEEE